jgi:hypothetical protein
VPFQAAHAALHERLVGLGQHRLLHASRHRQVVLDPDGDGPVPVTPHRPLVRLGLIPPLQRPLDAVAGHDRSTLLLQRGPFSQPSFPTSLVIEGCDGHLRLGQAGRQGPLPGLGQLVRADDQLPFRPADGFAC